MIWKAASATLVASVLMVQATACAAASAASTPRSEITNGNTAGTAATQERTVSGSSGTARPGATTAGQRQTVQLTVTVGLVAPGGAPMAPPDMDRPPVAGGLSGTASPPNPPGGTAPAAPALPIEPVAGVAVWAVAPGDATATPEATAVTDANGVALLQLSAGPHWVFVPRTMAAESGPLGAVITGAMPDGSLTPMWAAVDLTDGNPAAITLAGTQLNP